MLRLLSILSRGDSLLVPHPLIASRLSCNEGSCNDSSWIAGRWALDRWIAGTEKLVNWKKTKVEKPGEALQKSAMVSRTDGKMQRSLLNQSAPMQYPSFKIRGARNGQVFWSKSERSACSTAIYSFCWDHDDFTCEALWEWHCSLGTLYCTMDSVHLCSSTQHPRQK